jgi:protein-S-isoprenylcysteine O-methyltransferase Ste14
MGLGSRLLILTVVLLALAVAVVFLPAGSWSFWQGWAFLAAYFIPSTLGFIYFFRHGKDLVESRLRTEEKVEEQKLLIRVGRLLFLVALALPGFDYRLGWSRNTLGAVPVWLTAVSLAMVAFGAIFVLWVFKVNSFAGRTIEVETGQAVVSTGPYAWVRHPMYTGSLVLFMFTPLALGSWVALPAFALLIPFFALRLLNEEKVLHAELAGYPEFCTKTRYHLIPLVW